MMTTKVVLRLQKNVRDLAVELRYLPLRRKIMIASILLIGASFITAPAGVLLLTVFTVYEWRLQQKNPATRITWRIFLTRSIVGVPGTVLVCSALFGALYHGHYPNALLAVFVLAPIVACATLFPFLWKREDALHFARYSVMLILPVTVFAIAAPWTGSLMTGQWHNLRLMGTFNNPNYFSYALELFLILAIALFYHVWHRTTRNRIIVSFVAGLFCLYLTGSRTGIIAFLVGVTIFLFSMSEKGLLSAAFAVMALTLALAAVFPEKIVDVLGDVLPRSSQYIRGFENRFELWNIALRQIQKEPFIGTGLYTYVHYIPVNAPSSIRGAVHAHNIFLNFWLETGLFGVLSFIWILLRSALFALRRIRSSPFRPFYAAGLGIIAMTVVHGIMDAPLVSSQTIAFFGLFLGAMCTVREEIPRAS
jgi:O-antigen ligase